MNCPQCGTSVAEGTSICPKCDHILDLSFLSLDPPEPNDDHTPAVARPAPPSPRPSSPGMRKPPPPGKRPRRPGTGARPAARRPPPQDPGDSTNIKSMDAIEAEHAARPLPAAQPRYGEPGFSGPARTVSSSGMVPPEEVFADAKNFVGGLPTSDKLALIGASATILLCFLPWKVTFDEGEVIGLMSLGVIALIANAVGVGALVARVNRSLPGIHPIVPWLAQLGSFGFGILWCLVFMKLSSNDTMTQSLIGNAQVPASTPAFGVYLALLTELVALGGTLMGLKEKPV